MPQLEIYQFPCLSDKFGVLILDAAAGVPASIDAPDAKAVGAALKEKGWKLTHILNTHHHGDHTGGNAVLKAETGCTIIGPRNEAGKIPGLDKAVGEGDTFTFGEHAVKVLDTPGHTAGHITYVIPSAKATRVLVPPISPARIILSPDFLVIVVLFQHALVRLQVTVGCTLSSSMRSCGKLSGYSRCINSMSFSRT